MGDTGKCKCWNQDVCFPHNEPKHFLQFLTNSMTCGTRRFNAPFNNPYPEPNQPKSSHHILFSSLWILTGKRRLGNPNRRYKSNVRIYVVKIVKLSTKIVKISNSYNIYTNIPRDRSQKLRNMTRLMQHNNWTSWVNGQSNRDYSFV